VLIWPSAMMPMSIPRSASGPAGGPNVRIARPRSATPAAGAAAWAAVLDPVAQRCPGRLALLPSRCRGLPAGQVRHPALELQAGHR
jgi:hypothetical protein